MGKKSSAKSRLKSEQILPVEAQPQRSNFRFPGWGSNRKIVTLPIIAFLLLTYSFFTIYYQNRFLPGVKIAHQSLGGQSPLQTKAALEKQLLERVSSPLTLTFQDQSFSLDLAAASPQFNLQATVNRAYAIGHSESLAQNALQQLTALIQGFDLQLNLTYQQPQILTTQINQLNSTVSKKPKNAQIVIDDDQVTVTASLPGQSLDEKLLKDEIDSYLRLEAVAPTTLPVRAVAPLFTEKEAEPAKLALERAKSSPIRLRFGEDLWTIDQPTLYSLLNLTHPQSDLTSSILDEAKLTLFINELATKIDQPSQDAKFIINPSYPDQLRVEQFQPAKEGRKLNTEKTISLINQALSSPLTSEIDLPVTKLLPKVTNEQVNNLGIKQLLAEGLSNFAGSIPNRAYNISLAASRLHGVLIAPGDTFSFNDTIGDVSAATGYRQAYVIKSGRTVLDDGGGVCQVSTTLFRAALKAGIPIVERTGHAYRVGYYEQGFPPGLDATVFAPSVDLKFKNDTPTYILIQAYVAGNSLYVNLYGTDDGRIAKLSTPKVSGQTPPPPELRQDDPTLPRGEVKQVDWPAWGANVSFTRTVERGGQTLISETWRTSYRPWQAVYLVGTKD